ncbi:FAD-dependent oxidoreductase [Aeromicrobium sp.]|uniref:FAD-dependent oxidoreductase n=1 Tax=Aeromicrobium sp. TaxID=1871063 RepID=UPI002FC95A23
MTSLWLDRSLPITDDLLPTDGKVEDLVVGGGITGLTTALLLARAGRRVALVEARTIGAVATGNTTAKLSLLQGTRLSTILQRQSERIAQAYVEANREGQQWLLRFCRDHDVTFQTRDAITYAGCADDVTAAREEHDAALKLGLDVRWEDALDAPFPVHGATVLPDQAQFDPMDVLSALAEQLRSHGGTIHQNCRVVGVSKLGTPRVELLGGETLQASKVVLATGTPILDRGLYFAKLEPQRSYALAFSHPSPPQAMYLSAGGSTRSVRDAPGLEGDFLLVGGSGHTVGRTGSELEHVDELREWTSEHFPDAVETHVWSAQDYESHDGIPYVGKLPRGRGNIYLATGFAKWGMTNGVAAARSISGQILGSQPSWAKVLGRRVTRPSGVLHGASINVGVAVAGTRGLVAAETRTATELPAEGEGTVGRRSLVPTGVSTVGGRTCSVTAVCTHLGGVLSWNDVEQSWDCPLHGSRFSPDGEVLEGPATRPLQRR